MAKVSNEVLLEKLNGQTKLFNEKFGNVNEKLDGLDKRLASYEDKKNETAPQLLKWIGGAIGVVIIGVVSSLVASGAYHQVEQVKTPPAAISVDPNSPDAVKGN